MFIEKIDANLWSPAFGEDEENKGLRHTHGWR